MKNLTTLTTNELRNYPADGSLWIGYDDQDYSYWGITEQADGSMVVHLEHADAGGCQHDIEVAKQDMDEPFWDL